MTCDRQWSPQSRLTEEAGDSDVLPLSLPWRQLYFGTPTPRTAFGYMTMMEAPPQAGARSTSRLDWTSARPLPFCRKTFSFLPPLSLPLHPTASSFGVKPHGDALWAVEATPALKGPNSVPDPSTLRCWSRGLNPAQPARSFFPPNAQLPRLLVST